jgi:hypothetical protein
MNSAWGREAGGLTRTTSRMQLILSTSGGGVDCSGMSQPRRGTTSVVALRSIGHIKYIRSRHARVWQPALHPPWSRVMTAELDLPSWWLLIQTRGLGSSSPDRRLRRAPSARFRVFVSPLFGST